MNLKFTSESDKSKTFSENEAIEYMNGKFKDGNVFWLHWDNGYSYEGGRSSKLSTGESIVETIKNLIVKKHGENPPVEKYSLGGWSGYPYEGFCCDKDGRFIIRMSKPAKNWSLTSDS
jgi:hypothetical protein